MVVSLGHQSKQCVSQAHFIKGDSPLRRRRCGVQSIQTRRRRGSRMDGRQACVRVRERARVVIEFQLYRKLHVYGLHLHSNRCCCPSLLSRQSSNFITINLDFRLLFQQAPHTAAQSTAGSRVIYVRACLRRRRRRGLRNSTPACAP